jgi:hypothetical protein
MLKPAVRPQVPVGARTLARAMDRRLRPIGQSSPVRSATGQFPRDRPRCARTTDRGCERSRAARVATRISGGARVRCCNGRSARLARRRDSAAVGGTGAICSRGGRSGRSANRAACGFSQLRLSARKTKLPKTVTDSSFGPGLLSGPGACIGRPMCLVTCSVSVLPHTTEGFPTWQQTNFLHIARMWGHPELRIHRRFKVRLFVELSRRGAVEIGCIRAGKIGRMQ